MLDDGVVDECNVRDRDGGLPRPRGRFLCLTVILKRKCYNDVREKLLLAPHLVGETSSSFIPLYADDAFAWVTALSSSCHAAAADSTEGRWTRFTIHLMDEKLEELLRAGTLQMPDTPGRGPYRVTRAISLETLVWEIQEHVVVPVSTGGTSSPKETCFPGAWWRGQGGKMRSLGETHFRPRVVDWALVFQENHPFRLCTIPRPFIGTPRWEQVWSCWRVPRICFCVRLHIIAIELSILEDLDVRAPPMDFQVATTHSCFHSIAVAMYLKLHGIRFSVLVSLVEGPRG